MAFVFAPEAPVTIPVAGTNDQFAVRRVYGVGRNDATQTHEMCLDSDREPPLFLCKPADAIAPANYGETLALAYPSQSDNCYYEAELVAVIGKGGSDIDVAHALDHVWGYAVGLDMTRGDLQMKRRDKSRRWETGKAFPHSAPVGPIHPASAVGHVEKGRVWLVVNDLTRQKSDVSYLIWSVAETAAYLSKFFRLEPGDLIHTGTLEGAGAVRAGDLIAVGIEGLGELSVRVM
jgi:fumarylpyruvate hydrolase